MSPANPSQPTSAPGPIKIFSITGLHVVQAFGGPSLLAIRAVLRLRLTLVPRDAAGEAVDLPDLLRCIAAAMPGIDPSLTVPVPAIDAVATTGTAVGVLAIALQRWLGHDVTYCASVATDGANPGSEDIVLEHRIPEVAWDAACVAANLIGSTHPAARANQVQALLSRFRRQHAADVAHHALRYAEQRGIPWRAPVAQQGLFELGQGVKLRRIWRNFTPETGHIGTMIASRKHLASALLRQHGLPVPHNRLTTDVEGALRAAAALGAPVVVKPERTDFGTAVSVNLSEEADIRRAFEEARRHGPVLVEQMVVGDNHRLLVVAGRFVSAVRQMPAQVVGDGVHSVRTLIEQANRTRTDHLSEHWKKITIDDHVLALLRRQGLSMDDVPPARRAVRLRSASNLSLGGTMTNVTADVHADNRALAEQAAAVAGLDVAGIDFITRDIARSHHEVGGAICEINPTPGFTMGEAPGHLERLYFDTLFGAEDDGRIDTVVLLEPCPTGPGADAAADLVVGLEALLAARLAPPQSAGGGGRPQTWRVGVAARGLVRLGEQRRMVEGAAGSTDPTGFGQLLVDPRVGAALLALNSGSVARHGLPLDRCRVAVITGGRAAGERGPAAAAERQAVVRLLSQIADAVLIAADDPHEPDSRGAAQRRLVHAPDSAPAVWLEATAEALAEAATRSRSRQRLLTLQPSASG